MWDLFISHASEDKASVARPLAEAFSRSGLSVWFDEQTIKLGDSLRRKIEEGLASCRFGVVIISPSFLRKEWPQRELDALLSREESGVKTVLPIWHQITVEDLRAKSPILASRLAISTSEGLDKVVQAVLDALGIEGKAAVSGKILRFVDAFSADPVSIKVAVNAFKKGEEHFHLTWPDTTLRYVSQLGSLLAEAENYTSQGSRFFRENGEDVASFIESAQTALESVEQVLGNAEKRVLPLLKGMDEYWGYLTNCHERSLGNFIKLANFDILSRVIYPLRSQLLYDEYFPKEYESWYAQLYKNNMSWLFDFGEPVYSARLYDVSGEYMGQHFWGPKSLLLDAYHNYRSGQPITNPWFVKYLIPQVELTLAATGSEKTINYDEKATINKLVDENGEELSWK